MRRPRPTWSRRVRDRRPAPHSGHADDAGGSVPGVEHGEQADVSTEMLRVTSDFEQRGSAGTEEQIVEQPLVLQHKRGHLMRQREDEMEIGRGQQLGRTRDKPSVACVRLALGTVPVAA